jgi:hypothetical protein
MLKITSDLKVDPTISEMLNIVTHPGYTTVTTKIKIIWQYELLTYTSTSQFTFLAINFTLPHFEHINTETPTLSQSVPQYNLLQTCNILLSLPLKPQKC